MKTVLISAGHSNNDSGAFYGGIKESEFATAVRNAIVVYLKRSPNIKVITDGVGTVNLPLKDAIELIQGTDLAIEIHLNAFTSESANGVETIALTKHKKLAQKISVAISKTLKSRLRGDGGWIKQDASARGRLGFVSAGGLVVELEFLSNPSKRLALINSYWLVARAIANVILEELED